jgi:chromosome segregation ATPase
LEVDRKKTELLATQHILTEEETKSKSLDKDLSQLLEEFNLREKLLEKHESRCKQLEGELKSAKDQLDNMTANFHDTEFNLQNNTSANELLSAQNAGLEEQLELVNQELSVALDAKAEAEKQVLQLKEELESVAEKLSLSKMETLEKMKMVTENEREVARLMKEL